MDRSMDSIGSCSLDVDAESSDISDTSGSLNFPTPISIKDITREFTANIRERCSVQTVKNNTTAYVDPVTGQVCIALTQPTTAGVNNNSAATVEKKTTKTVQSPQTPVDTYDKKPSYLNLACCVNGYSNITTYDSKIRQDINKSREVSPIRPSSSSLQYCKKSNSLAPPVLLAMPNVNVTSPTSLQQHHHHNSHSHNSHMAANGVMTSIGTKYSIIENNNHTQNGDSSLHNVSAGDDVGGGGPGSNNGSGGVSNSTTKRSFIQQRVERLYGPGALAQGFYSPKKNRESPQRPLKIYAAENGTDGTDGGGVATSELARKFQELSPSKDYNQFRKKLSSNGGRPSIPASLSASAADNINAENNNIDLPCLRHLSQEFRAQLPIVSPKRNFSRTSPGRDQQTTANNINDTDSNITTTTTMDTQNFSTSNGTTTLRTITTSTTNTTISNSSNNHHHSINESNNKSQNCNSSTLSSAVSKTIDTAPPVVDAVDEVDRRHVPLDINAFIEIPAPKTVIVKSPEEELAAIKFISIKDTPTSHITQETVKSIKIEPTTSNGSVTQVKDAHFFLLQLKSEQNRLLELAAVAEKYSDALASNPDITEDTFGFLRSASGKARLLVSQKMKQFEGLCHNNLNSSPEDQFPTTVDDLQGFWDMVYLQVDHIDEIFKEIEVLKANDWKKPIDQESSAPISNTLKTPRTKIFSNKSRANTPLTNGGSNIAATPTAAAIKREAQRKKLQEMKRRNREAMQAVTQTTDGVDILDLNNKQDS